MTGVVLLVNEAAINAAKHVYRKKQGTSFEVSLTEPARSKFKLTVRDDGPGLNPVTPGGPKARTMGMGIMHALAQQLGGALAVESGPGLTLKVEFGGSSAASTTERPLQVT